MIHHHVVLHGGSRSKNADLKFHSFFFKEADEVQYKRKTPARRVVRVGRSRREITCWHQASEWCQQVTPLLAPPDSGCFPLMLHSIWPNLVERQSALPPEYSIKILDWKCVLADCLWSTSTKSIRNCINMFAHDGCMIAWISKLRSQTATLNDVKFSQWRGWYEHWSELTQRLHQSFKLSRVKHIFAITNACKGN